MRDLLDEVSLKLMRDEAFARMLANRITRYVSMDEVIEEDKKEREAYTDI